MNYFFNIRTGVTVLAGAIVWLMLAWDHFHGGIPSHHLLARADMPAISNAWGGMLIPILTWFLMSRIQKRVIATPNVVAEKPGIPKNILYGFAGAFAFGLVLSLFFASGNEDMPGYMLLGSFLLALLLPIYRAEYLLGFVFSMMYTFGPVLPILIGTILVGIWFVLYRYIRRGILLIIPLTNRRV